MRLMPDRIQLQRITETQRNGLWLPVAGLDLWRLLTAGPGEVSGQLQAGDIVLLKPSSQLDAGGFAWGSDVCVYWRNGQLSHFAGDVVLDVTRPEQTTQVQLVHARRQVRVGKVLTGEHEGLWGLLAPSSPLTILEVRGRTLVVASEEALAVVSEQPMEAVYA